jgi:3'-phosphoadenosine 5'-phosphosulfate (PAPS) 3'-phosphatase
MVRRSASPTPLADREPRPLGAVAARPSRSGRALKFGVLAAGEADLYPRFGTTMEWDTAAGQAILEAAGGRVETLDGAPLTYGKAGLKNEGFLAWGRHPVCSAAVRPHYTPAADPASRSR